jgi:hypothetical protein
MQGEKIIFLVWDDKFLGVMLRRTTTNRTIQKCVAGQIITALSGA